MNICIFWFRRDLRLEDNTGLYHALKNHDLVLPLFIFDPQILDPLSKTDARVQFIHQQLNKINQQLRSMGSSIYCVKGQPLSIWKQLTTEYKITSVYTNRDYEPYARKRDQEIKDFLIKKGVSFHSFKDQVIFEKSEIVKPNGQPYTVFTPYKNRWLENFQPPMVNDSIQSFHFYQHHFPFPSLEDIGFQPSPIVVKDFTLEVLEKYHQDRDYPAKDQGSYLGPHLRFGTISIRQLILQIASKSSTFLNELIWREFFMQILYHFPHVVTENFKSKYNGIQWLNKASDFDRWCKGQTGYPLVDAGMRQLNASGYMHNRVRMITAGFLCKHLLIDWRWGEAYFASKLLDYELSSNNGNWQWSAGTGCDAAPYFRIFNPITQLKKFDPNLVYVQQWIPEWGSNHYPNPIIDHAFARQRALATYKSGLSN